MYTFQDVSLTFRLQLDRMGFFVGVSPSGKAPGFGPGIQRFESFYPSQRRGVEQPGSSLGS